MKFSKKNFINSPSSFLKENDFIKSLNEKYDIKCIAKNIGCMMKYMNYMPKTLAEIMKFSFHQSGE